MDKFQKVGLSLLGSALGIWGVLELYKNVVNWGQAIATVLIGGALIAVAAILAKKGIDVGGQK
jgi:hypothetical protein